MSSFLVPLQESSDYKQLPASNDAEKENYVVFFMFPRNKRFIDTFLWVILCLRRLAMKIYRERTMIWLAIDAISRHTTKVPRYVALCAVAVQPATRCCGGIERKASFRGHRWWVVSCSYRSSTCACSPLLTTAHHYSRVSPITPRTW